MEEVKLTKEQEILFEVYDKGVQNEDCDLDAYVEKMKQALSIASVSGSATDFYSDLMRLINAHCAKGLKKTDLVDKMEYATDSCKMS